jgi:putative addiction module component (TIGR02574 family)
MYPTMKSLGIDKLSVAERIILVEEIWDSIAEENAAKKLDDGQREELARRNAEYEAKPQELYTWEEVKAHARGKS